MNDTEQLQECLPLADNQLKCGSMKQTTKEVEKEAFATQNSPFINAIPSRDCKATSWTYFKVVTSVAAHIGFITSFVVVIWSKSKDSKAKSEEHLYYNVYLVSSLFAGFFYILVMVEAAACDTYQYIKKFHQTQTAEEYVQRVRDARPQIRWHAECYHYEVRAQGRIQRDHKGRANMGQMRRKEKVKTQSETEAFKFNTWKDLSRDITGFLSAKVTRIECSKVFIFKDERSKENYMEQYIMFRERNRRRDEFMEHEEEFSVPGFQEKLTTCTRVQKRPCWLREVWFWICTMFLLSWPYRWLFRSCSTKMYVIFIKELEV